MKFLKGLILVIVVLVALVLITALFVAKDYSVAREVTIAKPKAAVFQYISQIKNQDYYSKWNMADPNTKKEYRGTDGTPGFVYAWDSKKMGKGEQEIKSIKPDERLDMEIRFEKPLKSTAQSFMSTDAIGDAQTKVTWSVSGKSAWPWNFMNLFMEKMMGGDLETGLANLKANLEKQQL